MVFVEHLEQRPPVVEKWCPRPYDVFLVDPAKCRHHQLASDHLIKPSLFTGAEVRRMCHRVACNFVSTPVPPPHAVVVGPVLGNVKRGVERAPIRTPRSVLHNWSNVGVGRPDMNHEWVSGWRTCVEFRLRGYVRMQVVVESYCNKHRRLVGRYAVWRRRTRTVALVLPPTSSWIARVRPSLSRSSCGEPPTHASVATAKLVGLARGPGASKCCACE